MDYSLRPHRYWYVTRGVDKDGREREAKFAMVLGAYEQKRVWKEAGYTDVTVKVEKE